MIDQRRSDFTVEGVRCAAWITRDPEGGPRPGVVLVHGFGATRAMSLEQYERAFAAAGFAVLSFDFRHLGASDGEPRQVISLRRQLRDVDAAWRHLRSQTGVDPDRVALWGTSLGATLVVRQAAREPRVAAAVLQCPVVHGGSAGRSSGLRALLRVSPAIFEDAVRVATRGRARRYVPIVGEPGVLALVTVPGAAAGWRSVVPPGVDFDNRVAAVGALELVASNAARRSARVRCPMLVCVSDRERLLDPAIVVRAATRAPRGVVRHYDTDHFDVYHAPLFDSIVADQIAFLLDVLVAPVVEESGRA